MVIDYSEMEDSILQIDFKKEIHDKKINFLIGSGASFGALTTLEMNIYKDGKKLSFEDLVCNLETEDKKIHSYLLFSEHYCKKIIQPSYIMDFVSDPNVTSVASNYKKFLEYILKIISLKKINDHKKCNIFTTNYDLFFENSADELIEEKRNFILNDGGKGFRQKVLSASTFSLQFNNIGVFDAFISEIPMINLIKLHGSISWRKKGDEIIIDYQNKFPIELPVLKKDYLDKVSNYDEIQDIDIDVEDEKELEKFWSEYRNLPIVNPTKWKFHETVFEQHYYQLLRLLSYELEKKDAFLIVFGFSFKDEHIYDLVRRSLMNPQLSVFIFCFNEEDLNQMKLKFAGFQNVFFVIKHEKNNESKIESLDFNVFIDILNGNQNKDTWKVME